QFVSYFHAQSPAFRLLVEPFAFLESPRNPKFGQKIYFWPGCFFHRSLHPNPASGGRRKNKAPENASASTLGKDSIGREGYSAGRWFRPEGRRFDEEIFRR